MCGINASKKIDEHDYVSFNDCVSMSIKSKTQLSLNLLLTFKDISHYVTRSSSLSRNLHDVWSRQNVAHPFITRDGIPLEESGNTFVEKTKEILECIFSWEVHLISFNLKKKITVRILHWKVQGSPFVVLHVIITKADTSWEWKKKLKSVKVKRLSFSVITTVLNFE
jgi:hypothetical protein